MHPEPSDRPLHSRQKVLLSHVLLNDDNGGIVLDISERGLAIRTVQSIVVDTDAFLHFQLSRFNYWIKARGRIVWISASKHTAGLEFVDLPNDALLFIRNID